MQYNELEPKLYRVLDSNSEHISKDSFIVSISVKISAKPKLYIVFESFQTDHLLRIEATITGYS